MYKVKGTTNEWKKRDERKVGDPCDCQSKCFEKIGMEKLKIMNNNFWKLKNYELQNQHLEKLIVQNETKAQKIFGDSNSARNKYKCSFFVCWNNEKIAVCKKAFLSIHDINKDRVRSVNNKRTETGTLTPDLRGTVGTHNAHSEERVQSVHDHIKLIPVRSSHYTRKHNENRQYIDHPDKMSIPDLYEKYQEFMQTQRPGIEEVSLDYYRNIFTKCYNIESEKPKADTCDTCAEIEKDIEKLKAAGKDYTAEEKKLKDHQDKANAAYDELANGKVEDIWDPKEWLVLCMDLQQTHMIPKSSNGSHFYKRKLNVYNFCIVDVQRSVPNFYLWEEFNGRRGASEIYSCIYKFLQENLFNLSIRPRKLRIIADNCGGQNKNNNLVLALLRLVHLDLFDRIELAFMVPGHSYLPCDQTFGNIANKLKKHKTIASPDSLCELIRAGKKRKHKVTKMGRNDIYNIDRLVEKGPGRVAYIRPTHDKIFQTASIIVMKKSYPDGYILKKDFKTTDEEGSLIKVTVPKPTDHLNLGLVELQKKYETQIKICEKNERSQRYWKRFRQRRPMDFRP